MSMLAECVLAQGLDQCQVLGLWLRRDRETSGIRQERDEHLFFITSAVHGHICIF